MAYVLPDYDVAVECAVCEREGIAPLYEPSWIGEMFNWGSELPIYNKTKQERLRRAQGLYTQSGEQTELGAPTDVNAISIDGTDVTHGSSGVAGCALAAEPSPIEVVDVAALVQTGAPPEARREAAVKLSNAFARTGFALVRGHGVGTATVESLREAAKAFFADDAKHTYNKGRGYGFGGYVKHAEAGAQLLGDFSSPPDLVESLTIGTTAENTSTTAAGTESVRLAHGGAQRRGGLVGWAQRQLTRLLLAIGVTNGTFGVRHPTWGEFQPADGTPPLLREPAAAFVTQAGGLSNAIAAALELALDVSADELAQVADRRVSGVRLAHYASSEGEPLPGQCRYGAHIDSGMITVLGIDPQNPAGLQVDASQAGASGSEAEREWIDVPYLEGTLVLNVGALLSRWTGGRWKAAVHRVLMADHTRNRTSVVTSALGARSDGPPFAGFTSCLSAGSAAPVRAADFLATRVALHRPEYAKENGLSTSEKLAAEARRIVELHK